MMASSQLSPGSWWNKKKSKLMMLESFTESASSRMQLKTTIWTMMERNGKSPVEEVADGIRAVLEKKAEH